MAGWRLSQWLNYMNTRERTSVSYTHLDVYKRQIQAYGYDSIDDHNESNSHPSAATIPVCLALGEHLHKNGKELIEAIAVGNETVCRTCLLYTSRCV